MFAGREALVIAVNVVAVDLADDGALVEEAPLEEYVVLGEDLLLHDDDRRALLALERSLDDQLLPHAVDVEYARHLEAREPEGGVVHAVGSLNRLLRLHGPHLLSQGLLGRRAVDALLRHFCPYGADAREKPAVAESRAARRRPVDPSAQCRLPPPTTTPPQPPPTPGAQSRGRSGPRHLTATPELCPCRPRGPGPRRPGQRRQSPTPPTPPPPPPPPPRLAAPPQATGG
jgi:hypothetical protein